MQYPCFYPKPNDMHSQHLSYAEYKRQNILNILYYHINDAPLFLARPRTTLFRGWAVDTRSESAGQRHHSMPSEETLFKEVVDNVDYNHRATIVKEITHIHFTTLTVLELGCNRIQSVEGLARVNMAHIKAVGLCTYSDNIGNNNITSVGVMRKAAWPVLSWLDIRKEWIM